jgi:outer membrane protein OmpA-like peptidoglycan-associated protein
VLNENPAVRIKVVGHTDSDGDDALNLDLSKRRAANVKQYLINEFKIDGSRVETDGKGENAPIADNNSAENKAKNRRVEFIKL